MVEKPEDLNLPNAVISRIVKESLPAGTIVSKEARSAIARAASVFVLYATSTSVSVAQKSKKKTLSAQDVVTALNEMDFQNFVPQLEECLDGEVLAFFEGRVLHTRNQRVVSQCKSPRTAQQIISVVHNEKKFVLQVWNNFSYRKSQQTKKDAKKAKKADVEKSPTKDAEGGEDAMESEEIVGEENKENGVKFQRIN